MPTPRPWQPSALILRALLGIVFVWAGLAKVIGQTSLSGDDLARFAEVRGDAPAADPLAVRRVHSLTLTIDRAARPADGDPWWPAHLWKIPLAPITLAWTVAITELAAGMLLLLGLFTRGAAAAVALVMLGALWLTQFGPAIIGGEPLLGFLPNRDPADLSLWTGFLLQASLLASALALLPTGAGRCSMDARMFDVPDDETDAEKA